MFVGTLIFIKLRGGRKYLQEEGNFISNLPSVLGFLKKIKKKKKPQLPTRCIQLLNHFNQNILCRQMINTSPIFPSLYFRLPVLFVSSSSYLSFF